jgi:hypothetical protein
VLARSLGGGDGGSDEAVANEAVDVAVDAVMDDEAVGSPLLLGQLVDATINFLLMMMPMLMMTRGLLSGSDLTNAPVAESTCRQYNCDNADFMMYLWDDQPEMLSIPAMELLNRAWESVQRSCF